MITPDEIQLNALARLKNDTDFGTFMVLMRDSLTFQSLENNKTESEREFRIMQGRNQELVDILDKIEHAQNNIENNARQKFTDKVVTKALL